MVDVIKLKSHPEKLLFTHVDGVVGKVKTLIKNLDIPRTSELAAVFHDLGKINPNFQDKLSKKTTAGYSRHAYLSALSFYIFCLNNSNRTFISEFLGREFYQSDLIAMIVLIAKHHGHLPDFIPKGGLEVEPYIISQKEIDELYNFVSNHSYGLPIEEFLKYYFKNGANLNFKNLMNDNRLRNAFHNQILFKPSKDKNALEYFLNTQFSFASLILADKNDAKDSKLIESDKDRIDEFSKIYIAQLERYISKFKPDSPLNILRTKIRMEVVYNLDRYLDKNDRVFELTAPTGSGKTIMLLSLASKIVQKKGSYRILYALPFLSITEQVEKEVLDIYQDFSNRNYIQRIDSKSDDQRINELQKELDKEPNSQKIEELETLIFQQQTFSYPFIITTFVQFFETLLSNKNATLLKLTNFSNCIFLIDEIQALPPRLYTFFVAYLNKFCRKFNSYAIISTATQPNFKLQNKEEIQQFFFDYEPPKSLLDHTKYFSNEIFNRYRIQFKRSSYDIRKLSWEILKEQNSTLVILNTIDDSKLLFDTLITEDLNVNEVYLLNTHFIPDDRKKKIEIIKSRLEQDLKTILVSTQLIEAGVDIDFPILYRDFATISSIIQSAGRCNRNGRLSTFGKVILFNLERNGKKRAELIYGRGKDRSILNFTKQALGQETHFEENKLLEVQKNFFNRISVDLNFAQHSQNKGKLEFDFLKDIKDCAYKKIGKFQLIDEQEYGIQRQYFVAENDSDIRFEILLDLEEKFHALIKSDSKDWSQIKFISFKMSVLLKRMSSRIVSIRLKENDNPPLTENNKDYNGIFKISRDSYSFEKGVDVAGNEFIL